MRSGGGGKNKKRNGDLCQVFSELSGRGARGWRQRKMVAEEGRWQREQKRWGNEKRERERETRTDAESCVRNKQRNIKKKKPIREEQIGGEVQERVKKNGYCDVMFALQNHRFCYNVITLATSYNFCKNVAKMYIFCNVAINILVTM